jgi:hypothetical protein
MVLYLVIGCLRFQLLDDVNKSNGCQNSMSYVVNCLRTEIDKRADAFVLRGDDVYARSTKSRKQAG